jgi:hypothetical protein
MTKKDIVGKRIVTIEVEIGIRNIATCETCGKIFDNPKNAQAPASEPDDIDAREDRELNIRISGFEEGYAQGKVEASRASEKILKELRVILSRFNDEDCGGNTEMNSEKCISYFDEQYGHCALCKFDQAIEILHKQLKDDQQ